ncbi:MAG: SRPBCC family protein [Kineosporiaceae bacterium]
MTRFVAAVEVAAPPTAVWSAITDWPRHGRWVPLTTVRTLTVRPDGVGARFVGRTGIGPVAFDDLMEVTEWLPPADARPGRCAVRKLGRLVGGTAAFDVAPIAADRTLVVWEYDLRLAPQRLTRPLGPLVAAVGRPAVTAALRAMGREVEARHRPGRTVADAAES